MKTQNGYWLPLGYSRHNRRVTSTHIKHAETAHAADCQHWVPIGGKYLLLGSGKHLCALCGLSWCVTATERKALLGGALAPSGTG